MSLNNLSVRQAGDRGPGRGAGLHHRSRRHLPPTRPGQPRRLPARPRRVADRPRHSRGRRRRASERWTRSRPPRPISHLVPAREVLLARSQARHSRGDPAGAQEDVVAAAGVGAGGDRRPVGRARAGRAVLAAAQQLSADLPPDDLPGWAQRPIPDAVVEILNAWPNPSGWRDRADLARRARPDCRGTSSTPNSSTLRSNPSQSWPRSSTTSRPTAWNRCSRSFRTAGEHADLVLGVAGHRDLVGIPTPPPTTSSGAHRAEDGRPAQPGQDDPLIAQHLAILRLATRLPVADVYDCVTNVDIAVDTAMTCIDQCNIDLLPDLWLAAPGLGKRRFVAPFLAAVFTVVATTEEHPADRPEDLMREAAGRVATPSAPPRRHACAAWRDASLTASRPCSPAPRSSPPTPHRWSPTPSPGATPAPRPPRRGSVRPWLRRGSAGFAGSATPLGARRTGPIAPCDHDSGRRTGSSSSSRRDLTVRGSALACVRVRV